MSWFIFYLNDLDKDKLNAEVNAWINENKTKTVKAFFYNSNCPEIGKTFDSNGVLKVKLRSQRDAILFKLFFNDWLIEKPKTRRELEEDIFNMLAAEIAKEIDKHITQQLCNLIKSI